MTEISPFIIDNWHPISAVADVPASGQAATRLLDVPLTYSQGTNGVVAARADTGATLPTLEQYGFVWTSLGTPRTPLFEIPEFFEPDRNIVSAGPIGVAISAPRAIENFLDMGHFPYVHTGILGEEPHTEVKEYDVDISVERDEIVATRCRFFQPMAALSAEGGAEVEYIYRVPHPYSAVLYKSCPTDPSRMDVICIFAQSLSQESIKAHLLLVMIDDVNGDTAMRRFQQTIFGQDKPILENQYPKRLPLDPRAETPIRADKSAIAYRRWLDQKGVNYGTIPNAS